LRLTNVEHGFFCVLLLLLLLMLLLLLGITDHISALRS